MIDYYDLWMQVDFLCINFDFHSSLLTRMFYNSHSGYKWCIIEADGDKWCLSLVHTTLQVFLTVAHHQRLHLIITNADTNFKSESKSS